VTPVKVVDASTLAAVLFGKPEGEAVPPNSTLVPPSTIDR